MLRNECTAREADCGQHGHSAGPESGPTDPAEHDMFYLDTQSASPIHKSVFSIASLLGLLAATLPARKQPTLTAHDAVFFALLAIYYLRLLVTVWVFQKRKWTAGETAIISLVIPLAFYSLSEWNALPGQHRLALDSLALVLYFGGSFINTASEYTRHRGKQTNPGRLYTLGLFRHARHINFLGDILLFTGLALFTGSHYALLIPLIMTVNFVVFVIPALDAYLKRKYRDDYLHYSQTVRRLVPYLY